jgi:hypothetical protein
MPAPIFARCVRAATALGLALSLSSCLDIEQNLVLNPDGTGKVTMTTGLAMPNLDGLGGLGGLGESDGEAGKKLKPREQAREIAVSMLRAEGIEAWSDVTYGVGKDGKTRASVTGYFPDVTKVRLSNPMDSSGEKDDLGVTKTADGNWLVEDSLDDDKDKESDVKENRPAEETTDPSKLTDEEVQDKLDEERQQWAGMKAFMSAFFDSLRIAMSVQGGGTIVDTAVFEKKDERTAVLEFTGKKLVESVDALLQDDDKAKALIRKGISPTDSEGGPDEFFKMMFGGDGKMHVTIKPGEPALITPTPWPRPRPRSPRNSKPCWKTPKSRPKKAASVCRCPVWTAATTPTRRQVRTRTPTLRRRKPPPPKNPAASIELEGDPCPTDQPTDRPRTPFPTRGLLLPQHFRPRGRGHHVVLLRQTHRGA